MAGAGRRCTGQIDEMLAERVGDHDANREESVVYDRVGDGRDEPARQNHGGRAPAIDEESWWTAFLDLVTEPAERHAGRLSTSGLSG